ncbi:MAG: imidazole glycerol phosphate synthase subunit HisH [Candidatus Peribacteraceae bacterium]|nr:imidazole glycerol phosphate synthase subunit HisH [Candidatus Peribacteraceae bacterium]
MSFVAIIDYGLCNMDSVARAVKKCGGSPVITKEVNDIDAATHVILPGVGAFPDAMRNIRAAGLDIALKRRVLEEHVPFLGICLGMQLMAAMGEEGEKAEGLGFIEGEVTLLRPQKDERIPHIGWNQAEHVREHPFLKDVPSGSDFYFVHSYRFNPVHQEDVLATTPYGGGFPSIIGRGTIVGTQFHPEKSQKHGFQLISNFLSFR